MTFKLFTVCIVAVVLFVFGLHDGVLKRGGLRTWLVVFDGWLMLFLGYESDGSLRALIGILGGGTFLAVLFILMHMAHVAMRRRVVVYKPQSKVKSIREKKVA